MTPRVFESIPRGMASPLILALSSTRPSLDPLALLPADSAAAAQVTRWVCVASGIVWVWDFLTTLDEEHDLILNHRVNVPQIVYIIARLASASLVALYIMWIAAEIADCTLFIRVIIGMCAVMTACNLFLMFLRVRAVYAGSRACIAAFAVLWLAVVASYCTVPLAFAGTHIGTTHMCTTTEVRAYSVASFVMTIVYDTLVFVATTYSLLAHHTVSVAGEGWRVRLERLVKGHGMGSIAQLMLQTGQLYYLVMAGTSVLTAMMIVMPGISPVYHDILNLLRELLENVMAARIYRQLKLGGMPQHATSCAACDSAVRFQLPTIASQ